MGLNRRTFLKQTGVSLAAIGVNDSVLSLLATRYQQALAQPTNRKLALLVGINQYSNSPLGGCVTDVELQRELLIHRLGFQPTDILTLTDHQATRNQIETAFVEHLVKQAKAGDVVVFHFSGYGRSIQMGQLPETAQPALVTADSIAAQENQTITDDLLQDTLCLLGRSLHTDKVTTVLDTSYSFTGTPLQGNLHSRAYPSLAPAQPNDAELQFQQTLIQQGWINPSLVTNQLRFAQMPGVVLMATALDQMATEAHWDGFTAGLFTYALTQQLWQATASSRLRIVLHQASERISHLLYQAQRPQLSGQKQQEATLQPYFVQPAPPAGIDGVITSLAADGSSVQIWLGGIPASVLEQLAPQSVLTIVPSGSSTASDPVIRLRLIERMGLTAKATPLGPSDLALRDRIQVDQWVQEQIRVFPRSIGLTLALDAGLERIERVDAISALSVLPWITPTISGEQAADYLLSKVQSNLSVQIAALPNGSVTDLGKPTAAPAASSYGLFSQGRDMIPSTTGESGEAIKGAVKRLLPRLQTLLAVKYLTLTINPDSSRLPVRVTMERLDDQGAQMGLKQQTLAVPGSHPTKRESMQQNEPFGMISLPVGSRLHYRVENLSQQPLYALLFQLNTNGDLVAIYAPSERSPTLGSPPGNRIAPGEVVTLPTNTSSFEWIVRKPDGIAEAFILCSNAPFTQTLSLLATGLNTTGESLVMGKPSNPLEIAQAVLEDLHQASQTISPLAELPTELVALNCDAWAGFRFAYEVTA